MNIRFIIEMGLVSVVLLYMIAFGFVMKNPSFRRTIREQFVDQSIQADRGTQQRKFALMTLAIGLIGSVMPYLCGTLALSVYMTSKAVERILED